MVRNFLFLVICTGLLSIFTVKFAHADQITFYANTTEVNLNAIGIICTGPFFRTSLCRVLEPPGPGRFNSFYHAEINIFPPWGPWTCTVYHDSGCTILNVAGSVNFCVGQGDFDKKGSVKITIKQNSETQFSVTSNYTDKCDSVSTNAFLGDRPQQSKPDKDTFSFSDTEGDEVTLKLEEDGSVGHIGQEANFRLRGPAGTSLNEVKTGELPLEIMATIPKSGDYEIEVDQKGIPNNLRYRGGYIITLVSSKNDVDEIDPNQDAE